ncbi:MAG: DUF4910 domain-containing protein [Nitrospirae bacterium]|nr:DUF4910 domain-containing protein [Magnetococcales bacterium]
MNENAIGTEIYELAKELFPICRSITGNGVRHTLNIIKRIIPELNIIEVPTGTPCFDWIVPKEWNISDAYVIDPDGKKIIDFKENNLHVMSYSVPIREKMGLEALQEHLYSLPDDPEAIPYRTSYYVERWGFCLSDKQRNTLKEGDYQVVIESTLEPGHMTFGELILPGETDQEILLSTYICHPSMGNNEISGPSVTTFLGKWLTGLTSRRYTYRIIFIPETIGAILYLSRNLDHLQRNVIAGFVVTCVGDNRNYTYLSSRQGDTLVDRVIQHVLGQIDPNYLVRNFQEHRGSDERQFCSPKVNLPVALLMRTRFGEFPEYHTSRDDLTVISPEGLFGGYDALRLCIVCLEGNRVYRNSITCEPFLGSRGLRPDVGGVKTLGVYFRHISNLLALSDGKMDLLELSQRLQVPMWDLLKIVDVLVLKKLLE